MDNLRQWLNSWINRDWVLRGCAIFETFRERENVAFYLDNSNNIVWLKADVINNWTIFWKKTEKVITELWVWNVVKYIIETKNYNEEEDFLAELNIAYKERLLDILTRNNYSNEQQKQYEWQEQQQQEAA